MNTTERSFQMSRKAKPAFSAEKVVLNAFIYETYAYK